MLKFFFYALLCANAALLAYGQGWLGTTSMGAREPERMGRQINADKLLLMSAARATAATLPAPAAVPIQAPVAAANCTDIGNFGAPEARRFDDLVAAVAQAGAPAKNSIVTQEITSYMVMIPPMGSKEAADRKAAQLKEQGVSNYFIINDSPARWGISLGVFKSEAAAKTLLAALVKQAVTGARVAGRSSQVTRQVYRFSDIDSGTREQLAAIAAKFDNIDLRACK